MVSKKEFEQQWNACNNKDKYLILIDGSNIHVTDYTFKFFLPIEGYVKVYVNNEFVGLIHLDSIKRIED